MTDLLISIHYSQWILHALVLLPLAGAVPILLGEPRGARRMALVVTTLEFVLSIGLWWAFDATDGGMQLASSASWIPGGGSATGSASTAFRSSWFC